MLEKVSGSFSAFHHPDGFSHFNVIGDKPLEVSCSRRVLDVNLSEITFLIMSRKCGIHLNQSPIVCMKEENEDTNESKMEERLLSRYLDSSSFS